MSTRSDSATCHLFHLQIAHGFDDLRTTMIGCGRKVQLVPKTLGDAVPAVGMVEEVP